MFRRRGYHVQSQHKVSVNGEDVTMPELLTAMARQPVLKSPFEVHVSPFDQKTTHQASEKSSFNTTTSFSKIKVALVSM